VPSKAKQNKQRLKAMINKHVAAVFPGCVAEWVGQQGHAAKVGRTIGFRIKDDRKYRSNIIWINPDYTGEITEAWVLDAVNYPDPKGSG
jgi:hypothetical protein